ncbi:ATP-binding SpoIIE family protein phosphatase [Gynuella sunshinyii]|uniref:Response regulator containing a CheY-like receiver domain and a GGDEF domain n=1 Tax=Gynuella sunshinyii YC6258 TaxID=1445510 RepID=A0A0C5VNS5_9GAMM|nr:fused response regulator/phosphatase [Gynuella sunshinyii]AJQ96322.1 response regulator containing a CheY-like receiver domain and a GGDEF domain [Gynuella sunshinyii YC6258]
MSEYYKILVADDNHSDRLILSALLKKEGHSPILAENGQMAVELYLEHRPDIVLMDALMPVMDGYEATLRIKEIAYAESEMVPIIFLTSLQEAGALARCLEAGAEDFLSKPYNRVVLKAKLKSFGRMRDMHSRLQKHNRQLVIEQHVAKNIFDNVVHLGSLNADNVNYSLSPLAIFNGDTVLAEKKPGGGMHLFLGDFTGHGLPAAIGVMPLAEIFYGMTNKGYAIEEILKEINRKLRRILPVGIFCCGTMIELDYFDGIARIWVGGTPDAMVYSCEDDSIRSIPSKNLPLGVVDNESIRIAIEEVPMKVGDRIFCWSDGIHESRDITGEMFGEQRIKDTIIRNTGKENIVVPLVDAVENFMGEAERDDDITVLEAKMIEYQEQDTSQPLARPSHTVVGPQDWTMDYRLQARSLVNYNPLPMILQILTEVESLRFMRGQLYTLLAELFSNALEHGLLQLNSSLKQDPQGFVQYYHERTRRLESLQEDAYIRVSASHQPWDQGGELTIRVEDSGPGFDFQAVMARKRNNREYSGRGLPLLNKICDSLEYMDRGNVVVAKIIWPRTKQKT